MTLPELQQACEERLTLLDGLIDVAHQDIDLIDHQEAAFGDLDLSGPLDPAEFDATSAEFLRSLEALIEREEAFGEKIESESKSCADAAERFETETEAGWNELATNREAGSEQAHAYDEALTSFLETLEELTESLEQACDHFVEALQERSQTYERVGDEVETEGDTHRQTVSGEITGAHRDASERFAEFLNTVAEGILPDDFGHLDEVLRTGYNDLSTGTRSEALDLEDRTLDLMRDLGEHIAQEGIDAVTELFEKILEEAVEALVEEIVKQGATMAVGAATTTTIAPFIPALLVVKKVVEFIKSIKDLF